jgi:hypothetical protein
MGESVAAFVHAKHRQAVTNGVLETHETQSWFEKPARTQAVSGAGAKWDLARIMTSLLPDFAAVGQCAV